MESVHPETLRRLNENLAKAREIAEMIGTRVGFVSPYEGSATGRVKVILETPEYLKSKKLVAKPGSILAAIDIGTLDVISLRVSEVTREDFFSQFGRGESLTPHPVKHDVKGLLARPQVLAEPLLAFEYSNGELKGGKVADYVIEPHSPVVLPKPEYVETLLGVKGEVVLGALTVGDEALEIHGSVAKASLPLSEVFYHMFVVGTTGSGKTSFVKNMIKSLLTQGVAVVCIDDNGDYVQTVFDPKWEGLSEEEQAREEEFARKVYGKVKGLNYVRVILPVTRYIVEEKSIRSPRDLAEVYYDLYLSKICEKIGISRENVDFDPDGKETFPAIISFKVNGEERRVEIIPYALSFNELKNELPTLYPYFTARAREDLPKVLKYLESKAGETIPVPDPRSWKGEKHEVTVYPIGTLNDLVKTLGIFCEINEQWFADQVNTFPKTLDNIRVGLSSLNEVGIFDVKIGSQPIKEPKPESYVQVNTLTVFDLHLLDASEISAQLQSMAKRMLTLRLLNRLLAWKRHSKFGTEIPTVVLVDEAHRFFPRTVSEDEKEYVSSVSGRLEQIARLGRVRGLGLIISTHSPKDVHG